MKNPFPSIATSLVIVASTVLWIAGVSLALVYFLGLSATAGWWIAGLLGFSSVVAMAVILHEMRHAVEIDSAAGGLADLGDPVPWNFPDLGSKHCSKV